MSQVAEQRAPAPEPTLSRVADDLRALERQFAHAVSADHDDGRIAVIEESGARVDDEIAVAQQVQQALFDRGLARPSYPPEFGGRNLDAATAEQVRHLIDRAHLPSRNTLFVGLNIVAPAILAHGTPEQQRRILPDMLRGNTIGCQLFSEPEAGSDLAGVITRARRDGNDWIINGHKVWTSHAQVAQWGEALVRTDPDNPRHGGLTMLMVDMSSPGVEIRPLRQMTGGAAFNEVFLRNVRVPDSLRIGAVGQGWQVATSSLSDERGAMGTAEGPLSDRVLRHLVQLAAAHRDNPELTHQFAHVTAAVAAQRASMQVDSPDPGARAVAGSVQKLLLNQALDAVAHLAQAISGQSGVVRTPDAAQLFAWSEFVLGVPALHLAGGTDEIQREVIARRGLRLPRPKPPAY